MANVTMSSRDAVSGKTAQCYCTIDGKRYNLMNAINLEANFDKNKADIPILGRAAVAHKATGWSGTGSATFHYNTTIFRKLLKKFKDTNEDIYFDIQVVNEDPSSSVGRQSVTLIDCNMDGGVLARFDAEADYLDETIDFTFEDFEIEESFKKIKGM